MKPGRSACPSGSPAPATPPAGGWSGRCRSRWPRAAFAAGADLAVRRDGPVGAAAAAQPAPGAGPDAPGRAPRGAGAGRPALLRPVLAGDLPAAGMDVGRTLAAVAHRRGRATSTRPWPPAAAPSWRCRTAATGTSPGCGWCQRGYPFTTVAERLKPESLYDQFVAYRESLGMRVLPLTGGPRPPTEVLGRAAAGRRGGVPGGRPGPVPARGRGSSSSASRPGCRPVRRCWPRPPARRCCRCTCYFDGAGWGQWIGPPVELGDGRLRDRVQAATQALADAFAARIAGPPAGLAHAAAAVAGRPRSGPVGPRCGRTRLRSRAEPVDSAATGTG